MNLRPFIIIILEDEYLCIVGSVVECSPATRAARVRFPDDANFYDFSLANKYVGPQMIYSSDISTPLPISVRQYPSDWLFKVQTE